MSSSPISSSSTETPPAATQTEFPFSALGDVTCRVTAQLGTGTLRVRDCLTLKKHTIVRLQQSAGEDLLLVVNGVPIGRAEVAIIDNSTALRLSELLGKEDSE